jgi:outer membrane protein OmpA-like peptidoglycan-associated protein
MTDSNGEFEVGQLLPGTWKLNASESALPDNHYYEQSEFDFDVAPGDREEVLVNVLPKVRKIKMMEIVQKITLNIKFDFDKAKIRPEAVPILEEAYESIQKHLDSKIQLEGHTCNIGPEKYNKRLSLRRAKSVMNWFVEKKNVSESRFFEPVGYGEEKPIAPNTTREGREKNRRVEIIIHK